MIDEYNKFHWSKITEFCKQSFLFRGMAYLKDFFENEINLKNCFTKLFSSLKTSGCNVIKFTYVTYEQCDKIFR